MDNIFDNVFKDKKIILTGDTGFKGSWLAIWLTELGAKVYGFALPPQRENDNYNLSGLEKKINHIDGDVRNVDEVESYFSQVQPEFVFHLAAQPIVLESYSDPLYTFETNILGVVNVFEAVRKTKSVKAFVNITSDKCYQNNNWPWGYRESDPMGGQDPYSASKGCSELISNSYMKSFFKDSDSANIATTRAGNVIGGGDWSHYRIVPDFFRALDNKQPVEIRNPESTRPWQYVLEPLSGYLTLGARLYQYGNEYQGSWNFGPLPEANQSVRTLIEKIIEIRGEGSYEESINKVKKDEASRLNLDISKVIHFLKWKPVLSFGESVKMTVEGYQLNMNHDIYEQRVNQIDEYCALAKKRNICWANS